MMQLELLRKGINSSSCNVIQKQPPEVFYKEGVLRNFTKFTEKHTCARISFQIKSQASGLQLY